MSLIKPPVLPTWADSGDQVQPSNAEIQVGWPLTNTPPARQRWNWLLNYLMNGVRYFARRGMPDYGADETYMTGDRVIGDDGKTYRSIQDTNLNHTPSSSPLWWERWGFSSSELNTELNKLDTKQSCRIATTANLAALSGLAAIDGVTPIAGDRILVKDQTTGSQNGIYVAAAGAWTRATDADDGTKLTSGAIVPVEAGTVSADVLYMLTTDGTITIGVTALTFSAINGNVGTAGTYNSVTVDAKGRVVSGSNSVTHQIQTIQATVAANALTLSLAATSLDFRSATLGSGVVNTRSVPSTISLVVPSGATLATVNGVASRLLVLAIDNAGTVELAVYNAAGGANLDETGIINTTAISGASNSLTVYSTTARTGVPYRIVGFVDSTQATAGTWASSPVTIQGIGGQALAAMASIGYGQTWQTVTRTAGTTYYNTTGKPIIVNAQYTSSSGTATITVNGTQATQTGGASGLFSAIALIPPGASYVIGVSGSVTLNTITELR